MPYLELAGVRMPAEQQSLFDAMLKELSRAETNNQDPVGLFEQSSKICLEHVLLLEGQVKTPFGSEEEEIRFFKYVKPKFAARLLYYQSLFRLESKKPIGTARDHITYYQSRADYLSLYYKENSELNEYMVQGKTHEDRRYFLRQQEDVPVEMRKADANPSFSTAMDGKVAELINCHMLAEYIERQIGQLNNPAPAKGGMQWTRPIVDLGVLIRGLVKAGAINHGNIPYSKVIECFEGIFPNVNLRNFYKASQENAIKENPEEFFYTLAKAHKDDPGGSPNTKRIK